MVVTFFLLFGIILHHPDLSNANLRRVNLAGKNLAGVNFSYANLTEADLSDTNLKGTNFQGAVLIKTNFNGARFDKNTKFSEAIVFNTPGVHEIAYKVGITNMSRLENNPYDPDPAAVQTFDNLWQSSQPWILIYYGNPGSGKSRLLSWLIKNRCKDRVPYSLVSNFTYNFDIDVLFTSMADSIISTYQFRNPQADRTTEKLTGKIRGFWVGQPDDMPLILFFDDYQEFEAKATSEQLSTFLDMLRRAHLRLPGLRVVIASRDPCRMPDVWFYMNDSIVVF
jgi:hypothetical protein